jgi:hypothetical protein
MNFKDPNLKLDPRRPKIQKAVLERERFFLVASHFKPREYQFIPIRDILDSVIEQKGLTFCVIFPRQSGKNETQAQLEAYLLALFCPFNAEMIKISPTWKPQTLNAMARLQRVLDINCITKPIYQTKSGFIFTAGKASIKFMSGGPDANIVGATSNLLQEVDEAQDIDKDVYDKKIAPMAASTNATRVFWGTVWTSNTLLAREMRACLELEKKDHIRRVFTMTADDVGKEVASYKKFVDEQVLKLGRQHPLVKTQYFCEEIDAQAGMFNDHRRALMASDRSPQASPIPGHLYAFCIDVAGQDENPLDLEGLHNPGRDSETLSIVDVSLSHLADLQKPTYRIVNRVAWTGVNHMTVYGQIKALADIWKPQHIVIDATGVGEGQWSMLDQAFPGKVIPVKFTSQKKSDIGWAYIAIIETGRLRDCSMENHDVDIQYQQCQSEILTGPEHRMRWGVKDGTRFEGQLVHDDFVLADSLVTQLDDLDWSTTIKAEVLHVKDPLEDMSRT